MASKPLKTLPRELNKHKVIERERKKNDESSLLKTLKCAKRPNIPLQCKKSEPPMTGKIMYQERSDPIQ